VENNPMTPTPEEFNKVIHQTDDNGDLIRTAEGGIKKKTNWKDLAVDRQGRTYNQFVHGPKMQLDDAGFIKVKRREEKPLRTDFSQSEAFVNKYREEGYQYYVVNDDGGRLASFTEDDWEPVQGEDGPAELPVGQARAPNTKARLFRKPQEWYDADQVRKIERNKLRYKQTTSPKADEDQYEATVPDSSLR